jgi:hypothetical protein
MANSDEISDCRFLLEFTALSFNTHAIHCSFRASNFGVITGKNNFFQSGGGFSADGTFVTQRQNVSLRETVNPNTVVSTATTFFNCSRT